MKTRTERLLQILDKVGGIFRANRSRFYPRTSKFQLAHAEVRAVSRQDYQRLYPAKYRQQE